MYSQSYEGYFENGSLYVNGKTLNTPKRRRAFLTILDDDKERRIACIQKMN